MHTDAIRRPMLGLAVAALAACSGGDADPVEYFAEIDRSQGEVDAALGAYWDSPEAASVDALLDPLPEALSPADDEFVKDWMVGFWLTALDAAETHRDDVDDLDVPDDVREQHDEYVAALDALVGRRDDIVGSTRTRSGLDLYQNFWEPVAEIEAVNAACVRLKTEAALLDIAVAVPLCSD